MNYKILSEECISKAEAKEIFSKRKDLENEQKLAKEHVDKHKKISAKDALKLKESLKGLGMPKLNDELIIKVIDILPKTLDELKVILQMSIIPFSEDEIQKVFELAAASN